MPGRFAENEAGFTLVELLVALGVLSLASGLLVSSFHMAQFATPGRLAPASGESVAAAQRILRERLEQLVPVRDGDPGRRRIDTRGTQDMFSFTGPALYRVAPDALQRYRLMVTPAGELALYSVSSLDHRASAEDGAPAGWEAARLLSGVSQMELSYYGPDRVGGFDRWQQSWVDRETPPSLIRFRVRFGKQDRRVWPDLVVRPRTSANTACRIDAATNRCEAS